ncbi:hypothetical protein CDD82_4586 [Ophiocordyceps australis]|uniref:AA1-like domain-containing protein n=1 Tax=Ophiocordyceps australis TaxID=1399860 RepID=A0A2C5ZSR5_9HYPO|nr:hypothetical protein CDD82_4586 [Ophiocordyceps australis]
MKMTAALVVTINALAAARPNGHLQNDPDNSKTSSPGAQVVVRLRLRFDYTQKLNFIAGSWPQHTSPIPWSNNARKWDGIEPYISFLEFTTACHPSVVVHRGWRSPNVTLADGEECPEGSFPSKWHQRAMPIPTEWNTKPGFFTFTVFCNTTEDTQSPEKWVLV